MVIMTTSTDASAAVPNVTPLGIGCITFASVFGGALLGMFVHDTLPEHHLSQDSRTS
jgi:hypothetical protein